MFEKRLVVSGKVVRLRPYTEARAVYLREINEDIRKYIAKNPDQAIDDVPRKQRAEWWKRKAEVLWECDEDLPMSFFESRDFEQSLLKDSEDFFTTRKLYL